MSPSPLLAATVRGLLIAAVAAATLTVAAGSAWALPEPPPAPSPSPELPSPPTVTFGFGDWITKQINSWFATLVASAMKPLLDALAVTLLATPDVAGNERLFDLWTATAAIANSAFVLLATIGAITAMGHQTVQTRYAVKEVLPRLAMAILATNTSFLICGKVVEAANAVSKAVLGQDFDSQRAAAQLRWLILPPANTQIFYILLDLVAIILMIMLLVSFMMRMALVLLLVVAAPLALAFHVLPQTEGLARFWWRAFGGLLVIQVAQSLTLVLAVRIFFNQDGRFLLGITPNGQLTNLILALCLLIILVRIPSWISRRIFIQGGGRGSTVLRIVKYAVISKLTTPVLRAMHLGRGGSGSRAGGRGRSGIGRTATRAVTGKVIATAIGGPAGTAAATALTARGGAGAAGQAATPAGSQGRTRPSTTPAHPALPGAQPRWQSANRRWMPPDPHAPVSWGSPETSQAYRRWSSNPVQPWTPPDSSPANDAQAPRRPAPPARRPVTTMPPAAPTAWVPPGNNPAPPSSAGRRFPPGSGQGRRTRRPGGEER
ncbi:conjugal transfer protein TrbL family protein [Nonomuraea insulae]|uniref:Conjugal transfer protein TrbL family protein n=1 Tax=Nonomuraea insulae TaxID=1616787 RepID=A0ABW1CZG5_9ACTN